MTPVNPTSQEESNVLSVADYIRGNIREYGMLIALVATTIGYCVILNQKLKQIAF